MVIIETAIARTGVAKGVAVLHGVGHVGFVVAGGKVPLLDRWCRQD